MTAEQWKSVLSALDSGNLPVFFVWEKPAPFEGPIQQSQKHGERRGEDRGPWFWLASLDPTLGLISHGAQGTTDSGPS